MYLVLRYQSIKLVRNIQPKPDLIHKETAKFSVNEGASNGVGKQAPLHTDATGSKPAEASVHGDIHEVPYVSADDFEEGQISAHENNDIAYHTTPQAHVPDQSNSAKLTLHNSFELLKGGTEHVIGDAKTSDEESIPILLDMYIDKNPNVEDNSLRKEDLNHNTNLDSTGNFVKRNSNFVALSSSNPLLGPVNGKKASLITGPSSLAQGSTLGRSFPTATTESLVVAANPFFDDAITLQPTPVTINDEILGQDKRKVQFTVGPKT